jgi:ParB family chromosome partitioning protein
VEADDRRAVFVGAEAYVAAGGVINRDLFQPEHEGYFADAALLDRLVMEKLQGEAEAIRGEGWVWVEIMPDCDYTTLRAFGRVHPERQPLAEGQAEELDRLTTMYDDLIGEHGEDPEPEIAQQLEELSARIDVLSPGRFVWLPEDMARAGAVVSIDHDGAVDIERGLLRPEDRQDTPSVSPAQAERNAEAPSPAPSPLSDRLIEDLTAHRTAALRALLGEHQDLWGIWRGRTTIRRGCSGRRGMDPRDPDAPGAFGEEVNQR